ncbi:UvrD-like helicase [Nitzschia inconspicua]|uniref:UvrD-like helicase n=1 Tax=Nitzschia inconspicua TaxID=303405 RepID=A0A9K3LGC3_9STRA|nr:UvrD-like helicase [Nitzschia inconspicua]
MPPKKRGGGKKKKTGGGGTANRTGKPGNKNGNNNNNNNNHTNGAANANATPAVARTVPAAASNVTTNTFFDNQSYDADFSTGSDDDSMPGLYIPPSEPFSNYPNATLRPASPGGDSVESEEPPPLLSRTKNYGHLHGDSFSSDGESDHSSMGSMPALVTRGQVHEGSSDDDDDDSSVGPPQLKTRYSHSDIEVSSSSTDVPNLLTREDSETSDESDDNMPGLTTNHDTSGGSHDDGAHVQPRSSTRNDGGRVQPRSSTRNDGGHVQPRSSTSNPSPLAFRPGFLNNPPVSLPTRRERLDESERREAERIRALEIKNAEIEARAREEAEKARLESLKQQHSVIKLQSWIRMIFIRRKHKDELQERFKLLREYIGTWGKLEEYVQNKLPEYEEYNWEDIKLKRLDRIHVENELIDEEELQNTNKKLESAIVTALELGDEDPRPLEQESYEVQAQPGDDEADAIPTGETTLPIPPAHKIDQIQLTKDVLKWLDRQDSKYRGFFIRRICQLADGERSRILKKHLTGTKTAIWETYLDQKSGQRILWTECETFLTSTADGKLEIEKGILVWYVAKHDAVSRLMRQIDRAEDRSSEKLTSALTLFKEPKENVLQLDNGNRILADPMGDTPLKLHLLYRQDIRKLSSKEWKPRLHLTAEELKVVDKEGTVLVLGRSGTGKTICIANRMDRDRERNCKASQLFVARSRRICSYVRGLVEGSAPSGQNVQYLTFARFVERCERILSIKRRQGGGDWGDRQDQNQMTFARFKLEVYKQATFQVDALIVWSQIRSFIKGSVEAVKAGRPLTRDEYLQLGNSRCRLSKKHRESAYAAFQVYESYMKATPDLWDETDRINEILSSIRRASPEVVAELSFDHIYVDEVQDYAQAELALFFFLGRPGGLFLAGDTAQSVSLGVDFRFEELRSIGYSLFEDRRYVPDKPVTVNINFRSHSGILNVAAAILDRMFEAFPKSANTLAPDVGAFTGPRPSLLRDLTPEKLREVVSLIDSVVLLTHDEHVQDLKNIVGENVLVLGIRYSKGLEFPHVILVDFFSQLHNSHHKPWRSLLSIRSECDAGIGDLRNTAPEVETQLKLLYTAITRCSKRLFFAETKRSVAGDAFCKWLLKKNDKPLASEQTVDNVDVLRKTADEWIASGVDFGILAETTEDDLYQSREYLIQAKHDFGKANHSELRSKAETHMKAIDFQIEMQRIITGGDSQLSLEHQAVASEVVLHLLKCGLVEEATKLLNLVAPFVSTYSKNRLMKKVSTKILVQY